MIDGWVKIHRGLMEHPVWVNPIDLKIFIWLILKANSKDKTASLKNGRGYTSVPLKKGQVIFGRHKAEEELLIDGSTIYKSLQRLEKFECVKLDSNNQYTLITIENYNTYQDNGNNRVTSEEQPSNNRVTSEEQPSNNRVTSEEQPSNTSKELKEYKELKEEREHPLQIFVKTLSLVSKMKTQLTYGNCEELIKLFPKEIIKEVLEAMQNKPTIFKDYDSVYLTCRKWCKRQIEPNIVKPIDPVKSIPEQKPIDPGK